MNYALQIASLPIYIPSNPAAYAATEFSSGYAELLSFRHVHDNSDNVNSSRSVFVFTYCNRSVSLSRKLTHQLPTGPITIEMQPRHIVSCHKHSCEIKI